MTSTLSHLNSVATARRTEVLALSGSCLSSRQVVSFLNIGSSKLNQYDMSNLQFSSRRPSSFQSRSITILPTSYKQLSCCSYNCFTSLEEEEEEEDYKKNNSNIAITSPSSYNRLGGSSLSSAPPSSPSSSCRSCPRNYQITTPSIQINIVFPQSFQLGAFPTITMLAHLYSKLLPLVKQLFMFGTRHLFQVAVLDKDHSLRRKLNKIAETADTSTLNGLNYVFKEVVKALLQYEDSSFHFTNLSTSYDFMMSISKDFKKVLNRELERHDKDENTLVNVDDKVVYNNKASMVKADSNFENEYTVLTVLVLATGKHVIPDIKEKGGMYHDSTEVLQTLNRISKNEIQSVEVLWSPRKDDVVLLEDELLRDFPRLIRIENGRLYMKESYALLRAFS